METKNSSISEALRQAADLLDQHPDFPQPYLVISYSGRLGVNWFLHIDTPADLVAQKAVAGSIVKAIGGTWAKAGRDWDDSFEFTHREGLLDMVVKVDRPAVCERIVVGTETRTVPAVEAQPERTETVEKVEWRCEPLLAGDQAEGSSAVAS